MRLSHRQNRSILRVAHCLGAVSCLLALIYELLTQRTVPYILTDIVSLPIVGAVIYLLFARRRLYRRLAYGIFFAMCFVNGLFLLCYIYECATMVSAIHEKLINHIEHKAPAPPHVSAIISISKFVAITRVFRRRHSPFAVDVAPSMMRSTQQRISPCFKPSIPTRVERSSSMRRSPASNSSRVKEKWLCSHDCWPCYCASPCCSYFGNTSKMNMPRT